MTENASDLFFSNAAFTIESNNVNIENISFENGKLNIKTKIIDETIVNEFVETKLNYTYKDDFNEIEGSFPLKVIIDQCLNMTAPTITNVQLVCEDNRVVVLVDFTANGTGALTYGGSGWCEPNETCYPVRLYFKNTGAPEFSIAYNGYSVTLKSGNNNQGTIAISIYSSGGGCLNGESASQSLENAFGHEWKVELMNQCNQRSNQVSL